MSTFAKVLFSFLAAAMLLSVVLGYMGIARLHQTHYPPFLEAGMTFTGNAKINAPSENVILYLDSKEGKILVSYLATVVPLISGILLFKYKWRVCGFGVLICCTSLFCWIGIRIFLHAIYDAPPLD